LLGSGSNSTFVFLLGSGSALLAHFSFFQKKNEQARQKKNEQESAKRKANQKASQKVSGLLGSGSALEATQGQIDGFSIQLPYKRFLKKVASVGD